MSLGESVTVHYKTPYPRLAFLHLPWLPSPAGFGNHAFVPLECTAFACKAGNVDLNVRNDVGGTVT